MEIMRAHVQDPPIPLNERVPGKRFPPELEHGDRKALEKKRDERYATAVDFAHALRSCLKSSIASTAARRGAAVRPGAAAPEPRCSRSRAPRAVRGAARRPAADAPVVPVTPRADDR